MDQTSETTNSNRGEVDTHLSKGTGLIGKDVLNLPKIVRKIPATGQGGLVGLFIPNVLVKVDERGLKGTDNLDGEVERNRDDILEPEGRGN